MHTKKFSIIESLKFASHAFIDNFLVLIGAMLTISLCMIIASAACIIALYPLLKGKVSNALFYGDQLIKGLNTSGDTQAAVPLIKSILMFFPLGILCFILISLLGAFFHAGFTKLILDVYYQRPVQLKTVFSGGSYIFRVFLGGIIYFSLIGLGLILFIIPGIYFAIKYGFYRFLIVDKDYGVFASFKKSGEIIYGSKWHILGVSILFGIVYVLSRGLAILISPFLALAWVYIYGRLLMQRSEPRTTTYV